MQREMFWADIANGEVRYENNIILTECSPSQAKAVARELNNVVARACKEKRVIDKLKEKIGPLTRAEQRQLLLVEYAVMHVLDHE